MSLNKIFGLALIISVGWHLFWGLFFDLSLGEKQTFSGKEIIPVYYIGKGQIIKNKPTRVTGVASSLLTPSSLPQMDLIRPPLPKGKLPQTEEEMLTKRAKEISENKTEISLKKDFEPTIDRKNLPDWVLPEESSKNKEYPIKWESAKREVTQSYYPELPQWAEEIWLKSNVILQFTVSANGEVKGITTEKSSGDAKLDLLAMNSLRRWKFLPSDKNEEAKGIITINFKKKE